MDGSERIHDPAGAPGIVTGPVLWYALRTRSRHEKKVYDELLHRGVEPFLPLYSRWSQWKDRKKQIQFPLFAGYCFARFSPTERVHVLSVPGVVEIVGISGRPEPIPEREIVDIRRLVESRFAYDPHPFFTEGDEVEVVRGPLAGVRGRLLRKERLSRLVIAITLLRHGAVIDIHAADIRRV